MTDTNPIFQLLVLRPSAIFSRRMPGGVGENKNVVFLTLSWDYAGTEFRLDAVVNPQNVSDRKEELAQEALRMIEANRG